MNLRLTSPVSLATLIALGLTLSVSGCAKGLSKVEPSEPKITESELMAYCPQVTLSDDTSFYNTYTKGGDGDGSKVIYQAATDDVTRTCSYQDGKLMMKVAAAGRVVPGPQFKAGTVVLPLRVIVKEGDTTVYSMLHPYPVTLKNSTEATQFLFMDDKIAIPRPQYKNVDIHLGFETPVKQKKATTTPPKENQF